MPALARRGVKDVWTDPETLARAVEVGVLDAPHLKGHPLARGEVVTRVVDGACVAVDPASGALLCEARRLGRLRIRPE